MYAVALDNIARITCPALMLAESRKAKVIGRIKDLRVSMMERGLISTPGVFSGSICALSDLELDIE